MRYRAFRAKEIALAHPYAAHKQTKVEHSRVSHITKGYAKGGAVHGEKGLVRKVLSAHKAEHEALDAEGGKSKHRMDRPHRAKGGRVGKKRGNARTIVNVIAGGHPAAGALPPPPMGVAPAGIAPPMAAPPMAARPPIAPPPAGGPGMAPPMPMRAKGGRVNQGSKVFEEGERAGTQVQHDRGKNDLKQLDRPRVVTFRYGGKVKKRDDGGSVQSNDDASFQRMNQAASAQRSGQSSSASAGMRPNPNASYDPKTGKVSGFARGGRVESPDGVAKATMLPGGGGGGEARLAKAHRAARKG